MKAGTVLGARSDEYEQNMEALLKRLKSTGATLIWASTTPIGQQTEQRGYRRDRDVVAYNQTAARLVKAADVSINDLYTLVTPQAEELLNDGVHFTDHGAHVVSEQVTSAIRQALKVRGQQGAEQPKP